MLYKVLLVDDEEIIREGLKQFINWEIIGFKVVGSLADGRDAIEYISNNQVDLILTDVKMTYVSGVELAKFISKYHPDIRVVFLSAYSEFNYAVEAMKYKAEDYILKTASSEEIEKSLLSVKDKIDKHYQQMDRNDKHETSAELLPYLKEQFLTNLITGAIKEKSLISDFLSLVGFDTSFTDAHATLCTIETPDTERLDLKSYGKDGFYNVIRNFFDKQTSIGNIACIYSFGKKNRVLILHKDIIDLRIIECNFYELFSIHIQLKLDSYFERLEEILNVKQFKIMSSNIKDSIDEEDMEKILHQFENLISLINSEDIEEANTLFFAMIDQLKEAHPQSLKDFISELFNNSHDVLTQKKFAENFLNDIKDLKNTEDLKNIWLKNTKEIDIFSKKPDNYLIKKSLEYIEKNIFNDITLEDAAHNVYLSPAYFSRLFKKHNDMNFKDYIVNMKMEKAILLLKQPQYKIYEISEMLGYKDVRFFTQTFRKHTGLTPSEFRQ